MKNKKSILSFILSFAMLVCMVCLCVGCSADGVEFQDPLVERCVREALQKDVDEKITKDECASLESLKIDCAKDYNIVFFAQQCHLVSYVDLSDMRYLTGLKELEINGNETYDMLANLEAISNCTNLEKLSMRMNFDNPFPSYWGWCYGYKYLGSIVEKLPNLKTLNLGKDIPKAVQNWIRGSNTQLVFGNASDFAYEDEYTEEALALYSEKYGVYDYEDLPEIPKSREDLILICNNLECFDFNELNDFKNLKTLAILRPNFLNKTEDKTEIKNIEALSKLKGLFSLTLYGCKGDFSGLTKLSNLKELGIIQSVVEDASFIKKMGNLKELWCFYNISDDIEEQFNAGAEKLSNLTFLCIQGGLDDYSWLSKMNNLEALKFTDIPTLMGLDMESTNKSLINELAECEGIKYLGIDTWYHEESDSMDISGLKKMSNLELLNFTEPIYELTGYDEVIDMPSLVGLTIYNRFNGKNIGFIQHCLNRGANNKNLSYIYVENTLLSPYASEGTMVGTLSMYRDIFRKCFDSKLACYGYDAATFEFNTAEDLEKYLDEYYKVIYVPDTETDHDQDIDTDTDIDLVTDTDPDPDTDTDPDTEELVIEFYDEATSYEGIQEGWFADVVKERFNIKLSFSNPWVDFGQSYPERVDNGYQADIIILNKKEFNDCVNAGLIKDITDDIVYYPNLIEYKDQIFTFNQYFDVNDGRIYGIPSEMTNSSPTSYSEDTIASSPYLRWDMYQELGAPEINDLDDLLNVLQQMHINHPTNENGETAYPLVLWRDWDNNDNMMGLSNVTQLTTWYGEKVKESAILQKDGTYTRITDKNATYYKILKFFNKAYRMGLVDPESGTNDWAEVWIKALTGRTYLMWYNWLAKSANSPDNLNEGRGFVFVPIADQTYYTEGDNYYGTDRIWGIASDISDEKYKRVLEFLDWYASPEGADFQHVGIEGFNYRKLSDGKYEVIYDNIDAYAYNSEITGTEYSGNYYDGISQINQWIVNAVSINPNTGEGYAREYWQSYKDYMSGKTTIEWMQKYNAASPVEWMQENNKLIVSPKIICDIPSDTDEIAELRGVCRDLITEASWNMIFAENDIEFDEIWDNMVSDMENAGYEELYQFDVERDQSLK